MSEGAGATGADAEEVVSEGGVAGEGEPPPEPAPATSTATTTGTPADGPKKKDGSDWTKDEIREQAKQATLGNLTKEEEAERSRRNKELLPSDKNLGHMTVEEKYDFARKYKEAGNIFFKEGLYEFALKNYTETITYLRHGLRMGETDSEGVPYAARATGLDPESKKIIASCHSNMAACALKLSRYQDVIKHATSALDQDIKGEVRPNPAPISCPLARSLVLLCLCLVSETDGAKAKALFRRSKAYHALGKVEEAYSDIVDAKKIDQSDKAVVAHHSVVAKVYKELKKQEHEAAKTLWKGKLGPDPAAGSDQQEASRGDRGAAEEKEEGVEEEDDGQRKGILAGFFPLAVLWNIFQGLLNLFRSN